MKNPTFSICIPNYNYGDYIGETIQSVLNQSYQKFEIIVADNASTDNSVDVVKSFKDDRIRLIQNEYNIGFSPNLQKATMYANGDFINLLSSDDLMKPNALETYATAINQSGLDADHIVLFSDQEIMDSQGNISSIFIESNNLKLFFSNYKNKFTIANNTQCFLYDGHTILSRTLGKLRTFGPFLSIVYSRRLWEKIEGYNAIRTIGPDKFFNFKLLSVNPPVIYVNQPLFQYRMHLSPNAMGQQQTLKQQIDDYLYTIEYSEEYLKNLGLTNKILIKEFLDRVCLKTGLTQLVYGTYKHALRTFCFAFAAYPLETLKRPRTYVLAVLLLLGPVGRVLAKLMYTIYRKLSAY